VEKQPEHQAREKSQEHSDPGRQQVNLHGWFVARLAEKA
jgi:hypothetical protein